MNTNRSIFRFTLLLLALGLSLSPALPAQESPPTAANSPTATTADEKKPEAIKPAPAESTPPAIEPAIKSDETENDHPEVETNPAGDDQHPVVDKAGEPAPEPAKPAPTGKKSRHHRSVTLSAHSGNRSGNERVSFFQDSSLAAGEKSDAVISIVGSSTSAGDVADAVVSVVGNTRVTGGTVGDSAVAVLGSNYVNAHVKGEVVAVFGNVELGPEAVVDGDVVCVGGKLTRHDKAVVHGDVQNVAIAGQFFNFDWLNAWFTQCLLFARPLAFGPHLMWAWWIALAFLGCYTLLALAVPDSVTKCTQTLEERPGYSILAAVLTLILTPVAFILLALTLVIGIGFALIPLFSLGLFFAGIFGKVVMLAWLGRRITKLLGNGPPAPPVYDVLVAGTLVLFLYTVPVLGFVLYKVLGIMGLGVVVYTLILAAKRNRPPAVGVLPVAVGATSQPPADATTGSVPVTTVPPVISAATLTRAGFWRRLVASLLDAIMVGILCGFLSGMSHTHVGGAFPFWFALYCVIMWAAKGTTIGGIIFGLKVVRLDDRPVEWGVAIVRGLSGFLSLAVAGLGFIWVAFDDEKQSWHDKIAGTTIVVVPKGTPLL